MIVPVHEEGIPSAPGASSAVVVDQAPLGRLVVRDHRRTVGPAIDGEQMSLSASGSEVEAIAGRSLVCEWEPGPEFGPGMRVLVSVSVAAQAQWRIKTRAAAASCSLECDLLGDKRSLAGSIGGGTALEAGPDSLAIRSTSSGEQSASETRAFVAKRREELSGAQLSTGPLVTSVRGSASAQPDAEAAVALSCAWRFAVSIEPA